MPKPKLFRTIALIAAVACMLLLAACDDKPNENSSNAQSQAVIDPENDTSGADVSEAGTESKAETSEASPVSPSDAVVKINGGADDVGIYSVVVKLTDNAADKGTIEMVYYGSKGSPQENSIVSTFRIEYYKEESGTYEISTFFDGEVYQNLHHKDEMKITNTFSAALRAGNVIISYTPDGGETKEVFRADADYFRG